MAANYYCLLFDIDGTLLNFEKDERSALIETLESINISASEENIERFSTINSQLWNDLEKNKIKREQLGAERFNRFIKQIGATIDKNGAQINKFYMETLANHATVFPGAKEILEELGEFATIAAASNANQKVQMSRLERSGLLPYFDDIFLSEKLGVNKPSAKFFELALKELGIKNKEKVLMIGDSLTADIQGGKNAGIDTCWCNFKQETSNATLQPTYTVTDYMQLKLVAIGEEELKLAERREKKHLV